MVEGWQAVMVVDCVGGSVVVCRVVRVVASWAEAIAAAVVMEGGVMAGEGMAEVGMAAGTAKLVELEAAAVSLAMVAAGAVTESIQQQKGRPSHSSSRGPTVPRLPPSARPAAP